MYELRKIEQGEFPALLREIPDPPKHLYIKGELPFNENKVLCVVGSRHHTSYGKEVCEKLILGLRGFPITIVSGLALGIDTIAHKAALEAGLQTIALPGSGLHDDALYPKQNYKLAQKILSTGGGLVSEFEPDEKARPYYFPQRNRIMAGLSHATLIIEARIKSGTLITTRLASDYNREVLAVPGSILSKNTEGPHLLLKLGATPVLSSNDILEALGFALQTVGLPDEIKYADCTTEELEVVHALHEPTTKDALCQKLGLPMFRVNILVSMLELKGLVKENCGLLLIK